MIDCVGWRGASVQASVSIIRHAPPLTHFTGANEGAGGPCGGQAQQRQCGPEHRREAGGSRGGSAVEARGQRPRPHLVFRVACWGASVAGVDD
jgi:hypothetical protein